MFKTFSRMAGITLLILLVPLVLQLTIGSGVDGQGFNWTLSDFIIIGTMIFIVGLLIEFAWRKFGKYRWLWIAIFAFLFLWLWAELAVGIFTTWGS